MPREQIGGKGEEKRPRSLGNASPYPSAVFGRAHLSHNSLVLFRHESRGNVSNASVDAIKQPAGSLPGKKIGIRFQGYGGPTRRRSRREIPVLEVMQDLFDDRRVFDEADDA